MKKILILSGKGGTGKTTVASAFIKLLQAKSFADCDVDAPNLHITVPPKGKPEQNEFYGLPKASIHQENCIGCGACVSKCRFHAISFQGEFQIDPFACEGCGVCAYICPANAITMEKSVSGKTLVYQEENFFSTAKLKMGAGASGKLVAEVKKNMKELKDENEIAIIDGSPGIGCPVIASISGVDMVLIVTEPTVSGISDLQRILETVQYFKSNCVVCINKYDINQNNTEMIKQFCEEQKISVVGMIPFDKSASEAINQGKSIVELSCAAGREIQSVLNNTLKLLRERTYGRNM